MVCLGFEPGLQDGSSRRIHGAMAATLKKLNVFLMPFLLTPITCFLIIRYTNSPMYLKTSSPIYRCSYSSTATHYQVPMTFICPFFLLIFHTHLCTYNIPIPIHVCTTLPMYQFINCCILKSN